MTIIHGNEILSRRQGVFASTAVRLYYRMHRRTCDDPMETVVGDGRIAPPPAAAAGPRPAIALVTGLDPFRAIRRPAVDIGIEQLPNR